MIKRCINLTPVLSPAIARSYRAMLGAKPCSWAILGRLVREFTGNSGTDKVALQALDPTETSQAFKADVIKDFVRNHRVETLIEFGCGPAISSGNSSFRRTCAFEISPAAIERCRDLNLDQSHNWFQVSSPERPSRAI